MFTTRAVATAYLLSELVKIGCPKGASLDFLGALPPPAVRELTRALSACYRRNSVHAEIERNAAGRWERRDVPVALVRMSAIRPGVTGLLERHGFRIADVVADPEVAATGEFSPFAVDPGLLPLLARPDGREFRLVDGNHRAFQLVLAGARTLDLVFNPGP